MSVIAIDFGTSAVRAAVLRDGRAQVVPTPDGTGEIPAAVSFTKGAVQLGRNALGFAVTDPRATVRGVKRLFARGIDGPGIEAGGELRSPVAVAALLCKQWIELATRDLGEAPTVLVLPQPAGGGESVRAVLDALAAELGLASTAPLLEPVAAAIGVCGEEEERTALVADVGASQTTIALVSMRPGAVPELLHVDCEPVGGDDVDAALVRHVAGARAEGLDPGLAEMLRQHCEAAKKELAATPGAAVPLPPHFVQILGVDPSVVIDARALAKAALPVLHAIDECAGRVRSLPKASVGAMLCLVGGMTRLPLVRERIEEAIGMRGRTASGSGVLALGAARLGRGLAAATAVSPVAPRAAAPRAPRADTAPVAAARGPRSDRAPAQDSVRMRSDTAPVLDSRPARPESAPAAEARRSHSDTAPLRLDSESTSNTPGAVLVREPETPRPERPDSVSLRDPRSTSTQGFRAVDTGSFRSSVRPSAVGALDAGTIRNPESPAALLELPIGRSIRESDLEPIALPLLLLLVGHSRRSGTLGLFMDDAEPIDVPFLDGRPMLSSNEVHAVIDLFKRGTGTYKFDPEEPAVSRRRLEHRATALVLEGLRRMLRGWKVEELLEALGDRMERAPYVGPRQQQQVSRMGLTDMERRVVKFAFNGQTIGRAAVEHSSVGKQSAVILLFLLTLYDLVEWRIVEAAKEDSVQEKIEQRAQQLERSNHFQVLGLHWSALNDEIHSSYERLKAEFAPGTPATDAAPRACRRILDRIEEAYRVLGDDRTRIEYRRLAYPDVDFHAVEDLVAQKHRALSLRKGGEQEAGRLELALAEMQRSKPKRKRIVLPSAAELAIRDGDDDEQDEQEQDA